MDIFRILLEIQENHGYYFAESKTTVMDYIMVDWKKPISVKIKDIDIPKELHSSFQRLLSINQPNQLNENVSVSID